MCIAPQPIVALFTRWRMLGVAAAAIALALPALAAREPRLYIANYGTDAILSAKLDGTVSVLFDESDGMDGPFGSNGLIPAPSDLMLISNFNSRTVLSMPGGKIFLGPEDGLDSPEAIALAPDGTLYLADRGTNLIIRRLADGDVSIFDSLASAPMSLSIGGSNLFVATREGQVLCYKNFDKTDVFTLGVFGPGGNVAILATDDGHELFYLDDGSLTRINTVTHDVRQIGDQMDFADEGIAWLRDPATDRAYIFVSDFNRGNVWRIDLATQETIIFADRADGLAGPSALVVLPPQANCGTVFPCDLDCNGEVNFDDIDWFVLALIDLDEYQTQQPNCAPLCQADANGDGAVNFNDIDRFITCLIGK